jgi:hypothetical protein
VIRTTGVVKTVVKTAMNLSNATITIFYTHSLHSALAKAHHRKKNTIRCEAIILPQLGFFYYQLVFQTVISPIAPNLLPHMFITNPIGLQYSEYHRQPNIF